MASIGASPRVQPTRARAVSIRFSTIEIPALSRTAVVKALVGGCSTHPEYRVAQARIASVGGKIRMVSSAGTGHFYTTDKHKKNTPEKMEMKKYDPVVRKHVIYKETKIK